MAKLRVRFHKSAFFQAAKWALWRDFRISVNKTKKFLNCLFLMVHRPNKSGFGAIYNFLSIYCRNGLFLGFFLVVLLPKNFHFSFTSHLIGFADLPIITTKKREILTDTRKRASREKAPVNVRSTSECDTSECVEHN